MSIQITITGVQAAPAPDLPSHVFPGCGSDGATFRVTAGVAPSKEELASLLADGIPDAHLVRYDQESGEGFFVVVDGDAPEYGSVISLAAIADSDAHRRQPSEATHDDGATPTIVEYFDDLDRHDWYFSFSDDSRVYRNGNENDKRLNAIATRLGGDHAALYEAFNKHYFSGGPWSTPKWDKPIRPVDGVLILAAEPAPIDAAPATSPAVIAATSEARASASVALLRQAREVLSQVEWDFDPPQYVLQLFEKIDALLEPTPAGAVESTSPERIVVEATVGDRELAVSDVMAAACVWRDAHRALHRAIYSPRSAAGAGGFNLLAAWRQRRSVATAKTVAAHVHAVAEHELVIAVDRLTLGAPVNSSEGS